MTPDISQTGLTLNPSSGELSGTPTALSSTSAPPLTITYTVTASNSAGSVTAPLTITIYNKHQTVPNMAQALIRWQRQDPVFSFWIRAWW